jgi:PAS domain S-box-containing protein
MAQARLAAIVQSSDDAIVSKTLDGEIMSWNAAATRMFGYAPEEVIGRSISIIIPHDRMNEETRILSSIRRGEAINNFRTVRLRKDGTPIPISLTVSPVRNAAGQSPERRRLPRYLRPGAGREGGRYCSRESRRLARRPKRQTARRTSSSPCWVTRSESPWRHPTRCTS